MLKRRQSRHILNSIPTVIYELAITDKGFPTQWVSDSVKKILGYEVEEALAPDWWISCLYPDDREAAVKKTLTIMHAMEAALDLSGCETPQTITAADIRAAIDAVDLSAVEAALRRAKH